MLADPRRVAWLARALAAAVALAGAAGACQRVPSDAYDGGDDDGGDGANGETNGESGEPKLDTPSEMPLAECTVVDLLFVIDDSGSMLAEQAQLIASFDGFVAGIQENLDEANDYHIGVVTTDAYALNSADCRTLGALVTESADGVCGPWAAGRYISLADDLESSFTCAAHVGDQGEGDEHQLEA